MQQKIINWGSQYVWRWILNHFWSLIPNSGFKKWFASMFSRYSRFSAFFRGFSRFSVFGGKEKRFFHSDFWKWQNTLLWWYCKRKSVKKLSIVFLADFQSSKFPNFSKFSDYFLRFLNFSFRNNAASSGPSYYYF